MAFEHSLKNNSKYDLTYKKETGASIVGLLLLIIPAWVRFRVLTVIGVDIYLIEKGITIACFILLAILITLWVCRIAFRQNRNVVGWGVFAFLLPLPTLIIIGLLKKREEKMEININNWRIAGRILKYTIVVLLSLLAIHVIIESIVQFIHLGY